VLDATAHPFRERLRQRIAAPRLREIRPQERPRPLRREARLPVRVERDDGPRRGVERRLHRAAQARRAVRRRDLRAQQIEHGAIALREGRPPTIDADADHDAIR